MTGPPKYTIQTSNLMRYTQPSSLKEPSICPHNVISPKRRFFVTRGGVSSQVEAWAKKDRENMLAVVDCSRKLGDGLILFQITNLRTSLRKCMGIDLCILSYIDDIF